MYTFKDMSLGLGTVVNWLPPSCIVDMFIFPFFYTNFVLSSFTSAPDYHKHFISVELDIRFEFIQ